MTGREGVKEKGKVKEKGRNKPTFVIDSLNQPAVGLRLISPPPPPPRP